MSSFKLTDNDLMPLGTHRGKKMEEVPDTWFKWFWSVNQRTYGMKPKTLSMLQKRVMEYIEEHFNEKDLK